MEDGCSGVKFKPADPPTIHPTTTQASSACPQLAFSGHTSSSCDSIEDVRGSQEAARYADWQDESEIQANQRQLIGKIVHAVHNQAEAVRLKSRQRFHGEDHGIQCSRRRQGFSKMRHERAASCGFAGAMLRGGTQSREQPWRTLSWHPRAGPLPPTREAR